MRTQFIVAALALSIPFTSFAGLRKAPNDGTVRQQPSTPTRTTSTNQILLAAAANYITLGNSPTLDGEMAPYADQVDYYDQGTKTRNEIRKDLAAQRRQWTSRHYTFLRVSDIRYDAAKDVGTAIVHYTYTVANASKRKSGEAASLIVFRSVTTNPKVILVKEHKSK